MIHLIPKDGARVRDPLTKKLVGPEGVVVPVLGTFWFRRVRDGEMMEAPKEKLAPEKVSGKSKKEPKEE